MARIYYDEERNCKYEKEFGMIWSKDIQHDYEVNKYSLGMISKKYGISTFCTGTALKKLGIFKPKYKKIYLDYSDDDK